MQKVTDKRSINKLVLLFSITYMVSYITRINYDAIIAAMVKETGMLKSELSMAITGLFITYGAGQIISGICGDKFDPKRLVMYGLSLSCVMNMIIPFCQNQWQMLVIWSINGLAQAFMWPPIVKLMTTLFTADDYKKACTKVSWGSSFGTILVYLVAPVLIATLTWKSVFWVSSLCAIMMIIIWGKVCPSIKSDSVVVKQEEGKEKSKFSIFTPLMIAIMVAIVLQGMLRDGVTTWMPSYISEEYKLGEEIAILTNVALPIFSILCFQVATYLYRKKITNPLACAALFFLVGALSALALFMSKGTNAAFSVSFAAVLTGCMHGVNLMLICMIPAYFEKYGKTSTVSGILNSCTYIGSSSSAYGMALLSENFGWNFTLFSWLGIALLGGIICLICIRPWKNRNF